MYFHVILYYNGDSIQNEELRRQIDALRGEVRALSASLTSLRQDDIRSVLGEQIRSVLAERIDRFFSAQPQTGNIGQSERKKMRSELERMVGDFITTFQIEGQGAAITLLDSFRSKDHGSILFSNDQAAKEFVEELFYQMRSYMDVADRIVPFHQPRDGKGAASLEGKEERFSPITAERVLGPLSNSWRINVLMILSKEDESLAGLSKALGLKKGHLQFHLDALLEPGYITYNRKSHLYSISAKGAVALEGLTELVAQLAATA